MMKEKTVVCIGIFLILAVLTSCAFYYGSNSNAVIKNDMEVSGRVISFGVNGNTVPEPACKLPPEYFITT